jgi:hypothetical protein
MENRDKITHNLKLFMMGEDDPIVPTPVEKTLIKLNSGTYINIDLGNTYKDLYYFKDQEDIEKELFRLENLASIGLKEQREELLYWVLPKVKKRFEGYILKDSLLFEIKAYIEGWLMEFRNRSNLCKDLYNQSYVVVKMSAEMGDVDISLIDFQ